MSGTPSADEPEPRLTITLTVNFWQMIIVHLRQGVYDNVADILATIALQAAPQMEDAQLQEQAREECEALAALRAIQAPVKDGTSVH